MHLLLCADFTRGEEKRGDAERSVDLQQSLGQQLLIPRSNPVDRIIPSEPEICLWFLYHEYWKDILPSPINITRYELFKGNRSSRFRHIVRFIARVVLTISLRTSNTLVDARHQLVNFASLQTFKSPLLSVCIYQQTCWQVRRMQIYLVYMFVT